MTTLRPVGAVGGPAGAAGATDAAGRGVETAEELFPWASMVSKTWISSWGLKSRSGSGVGVVWAGCFAEAPGVGVCPQPTEKVTQKMATNNQTGKRWRA